MTKTQALQRLYKALTGNEGRNTGSKVIEDLAIAAENGEIGGGGDLDTFKVTITDENGSGRIFCLPNIMTQDGKSALASFYMLSSSDPESVDVVGYDGTALGVVSATGVEVTGDITKNEAGRDTYLVITGDGTITIPDK